MMKMGKDLTKKIVHFIKEKEIATLDEIRKQFKEEDYPVLHYHINKSLEFGIKKIKNGLYAHEYFSDYYLLLMKLNPGNIIAYHTALEFYGLGHTVFFTGFIMNKKFYSNIDELQGKTIKYVKPTKGISKKITRNNKEFIVTPLEATFLDCLLYPKYCGGFEELLRCLQGLTGTYENKKKSSNKFDTQINLDYLYELLKKYNVKKLYNLTGFTLEILKEHWQINVSDNFLNKINKEIREKIVILEESHSKTYKHDKKWNVKYPKELESAITGIY